MTAAESLRVACAVARLPAYSPSVVAKGMLSFWGKLLAELPVLNNGILQQAFGWNSAEVAGFRAGCGESIDRYAQLVNRGIRVSTLMDSESSRWQERLTGVPMMFHRGDLTILAQTSIGFSGSRDATEAAIGVTRAIARAAADEGLVSMSGGARGVDMAAHTAALEAGGSTVVLVPQGLETWRLPPEWISHADRLLVVSFDHPWADWTTPSAMLRNRAIVDLSDTTVIPQAGTSGGSHGTGLYALRREKTLCVADLGDDYPGNQLLLQRGARPIPWIDGVPDLDTMLKSPTRKPSQQSLF